MSPLKLANSVLISSNSETMCLALGINASPAGVKIAFLGRRSNN